MKKSSLFFLGILLVSMGVDAQVIQESCNEAKQFYENFRGVCQSSISAHNCIHLDVTDSYDFEGKEFVFKWQMGDDTELEGMEVNYCYQKPGRYQAVLTLLDPLTKATIKDEATVDIIIKGEFKLSMKMPDVAEVNRSVNWDYELSYPENAYKINQVYWYLGDGQFSCESKPNHQFQFLKWFY